MRHGNAVGLDDHTTFVQVAVMDAAGRLLGSRRCGNDWQVIRQAAGRRADGAKMLKAKRTDHESTTNPSRMSNEPTRNQPGTNNELATNRQGTDHEPVRNFHATTDRLTKHGFARLSWVAIPA